MGGMLSGSSRTVEASSLKTGDLLLICLPKLTSFGLAPPDMVRGLMGAQKGTFTNDDEKAFCNTWTLAAIVYRVPGDRLTEEEERRMKRNEKDRKTTDPYVLFANGKGIHLNTASEFITEMNRKGGTVVCRSLHMESVKNGWLDGLDHFYTVISPGGKPWKSGGGVQLLGAPMDPMIVELLQHVLCYVRKMSSSTMLHLKKYFMELSSEGTGEYIEGKDLRQLLNKLHDTETARDLTKKILKAMDLTHNDLISFPEFLAAFSHSPFTKLSEQSDAVGACSAQLIAMLYATMGVVPNASPGERRVLPEYFAKHPQKKMYDSIKLCKGVTLGPHHNVKC
jgi:hypothetical protein